jgi:hypothetical protein
LDCDEPGISIGPGNGTGAATRSTALRIICSISSSVSRSRTKTLHFDETIVQNIAANIGLTDIDSAGRWSV